MNTVEKKKKRTSRLLTAGGRKSITERGQKNGGRSSSSSSTDASSSARKPSEGSRKASSGKKFARMITCVFCNQKTSVHSIKFHMPACEERREREQKTMPAELRMPLDLSVLPEIPEEDDGFEVYKAYNDMAEDMNNAAMPRCVNCSRTFFTGPVLFFLSLISNSFLTKLGLCQTV
jgi:hypothetical protein